MKTATKTGAAVLGSVGGEVRAKRLAPRFSNAAERRAFHVAAWGSYARPGRFSPSTFTAFWVAVETQRVMRKTGLSLRAARVLARQIVEARDTWNGAFGGGARVDLLARRKAGGFADMGDDDDPARNAIAEALLQGVRPLLAPTTTITDGPFHSTGRVFYERTNR